MPMSEFRIVVLRDRVTVVHGAHIPEVQVRLLVPQWRTTMEIGRASCRERVCLYV